MKVPVILEVTEPISEPSPEGSRDFAVEVSHGGKRPRLAAIDGTVYMGAGG